MRILKTLWFEFVGNESIQLVSLTGCSIDIAIGFDISTTSSSSPSIFKSQDRLQFSLHEIVRDVSVVHNLCCATETTINNNIGFRLVSANGQKLNDYMFGGYSEDVVNKVMGLQNPQALKFNSRLLGSFQEMFKASNSYIKVSRAAIKRGPNHLYEKVN